MTELPATDYVPIACSLHSEYELAILHRQPLHLVWNENNVIHDEVVLPLDLRTERHHDDSRDGGRSGPSWPSRGTTPSLEGGGKTASGDGMDAGGRATQGAVAGTAAEEFLVCRGKDGATRRIRLDHVKRMRPA